MLASRCLKTVDKAYGDRGYILQWYLLHANHVSYSYERKLTCLSLETHLVGRCKSGEAASKVQTEPRQLQAS